MGKVLGTFTAVVAVAVFAIPVGEYKMMKRKFVFNIGQDQQFFRDRYSWKWI